MPFLRDFHCDACNERFEDYLPSSADRVAACPTCGQPCESVLSTSNVGTFSMLNPQQRSEVLKKRSHEHTMRELKKEPEKHGFKAADKRPWNLRSPKASS